MIATLDPKDPSFDERQRVVYWLSRIASPVQLTDGQKGTVHSAYGMTRNGPTRVRVNVLSAACQAEPCPTVAKGLAVQCEKGVLTLDSLQVRVIGARKSKRNASTVEAPGSLALSAEGQG